MPSKSPRLPSNTGSELVFRTKVTALAEPLNTGLASFNTETPGYHAPEKPSLPVPQINITTITNVPPSSSKLAPARSWSLRLGYNLKLVLVLLLGFYVLQGLQGFLRFTDTVSSAIYTAGHAIARPLSMFSITGITCTTVGYGCPLESTTEIQLAAGLDPYRLAKVAASLDLNANRAQGLIEQVVTVASGASIRGVRQRQEGLNWFSMRLRYMSALKNRESLGTDTKLVSVELGFFGDSLIGLAVDSQDFLDYFVNDFLYMEEDLHTSLNNGTHQARAHFEEQLADFILRFTDRLREYRTIVGKALNQSLSVVNSTERLMAALINETTLVNAQIEAKGYLYAYLKSFTFQGQKEAFDLEMLDSTFDLARSTWQELGKVDDGLHRMIQTAQKLSKFPDGYGPLNDPARIFRMLKSTLSDLSQKRMLLMKMFGEES